MYNDVIDVADGDYQGFESYEYYYDQEEVVEFD